MSNNVLLISVQQYPNLDFLKPLSDWMTSQEPEDRPTADQALEKFNSIIKAEWGYKLRWRLCPPKETRKQRLFADILVVLREAGYQASNIFCMYFNDQCIVTQLIVIRDSTLSFISRAMETGTRGVLTSRILAYVCEVVDVSTGTYNLG